MVVASTQLLKVLCTTVPGKMIKLMGSECMSTCTVLDTRVSLLMRIGKGGGSCGGRMGLLMSVSGNKIRDMGRECRSGEVVNSTMASGRMTRDIKESRFGWMGRNTRVSGWVIRDMAKEYRR